MNAIPARIMPVRDPNIAAIWLAFSDGGIGGTHLAKIMNPTTQRAKKATALHTPINRSEVLTN
jgi:hypothetical protein